MAISGAFAGLGRRPGHPGLAVPARHPRRPDTRRVGFIGIAVALLGRNTAVGVAFAALLFGALLYGTSTRSLDPNVFDPSLAGNLTTMIQALVLLFIGADVLILYLWNRKGRPRLRLPRLPRRIASHASRRPASSPRSTTPPRPVGRRCWTGPATGRWRAFRAARRRRGSRGSRSRSSRSGSPCRRWRRGSAAVPIVIAVVALALGAWTAWKGRRRLGITAMVLAARVRRRWASRARSRASRTWSRCSCGGP